MPSVNEVVGALERRELAVKNEKEHLENVTYLLKERYKTANEYLISLGEKHVKESKEDLDKYENELSNFKNGISFVIHDDYAEMILTHNNKTRNVKISLEDMELCKQYEWK